MQERTSLVRAAEKISGLLRARSNYLDWATSGLSQPRNLHTPASEGPLIGKGSRDAVEDTDASEEVEEIGEGFVILRTLSGRPCRHKIQ